MRGIRTRINGLVRDVVRKGARSFTERFETNEFHLCDNQITRKAAEQVPSREHEGTERDTEGVGGDMS